MQKGSHYYALKDKWVQRNFQLHKKLVTKHKDISPSQRLFQHLIGGVMLASTPFLAVSPSAAAISQPVPVPTPVQSPTISKEKLIELLKKKLPEHVRPLTDTEEQDIVVTLSANLGIGVKAQINGIRLNRSYGLIGQEQHLPRYPEDTIFRHFSSDEDTALYFSYGMTPGRGAWGYFANSQSALTEEDVLREKYYIAVPTFLAPGWNEHTDQYKDFFKFRKMLLVNPENGKAIVTDIADAGPAPFTGKHLGGSPEVMKYLERYDGAQRGPVLYFFVEDNDTIPLGPVNL